MRTAPSKTGPEALHRSPQTRAATGKLLLRLLAVACGWHASSANASDALISRPLAPASRPSEPRHSTLFESIPSSSSGIDFIATSDLPEGYEMHITSFASTAGVAIGDYDSDSRPDIVLANMNAGARLYRNLGDFHFEDVTDSAGLDLSGFWATGVSFADVNNDGKLDLYVCGFKTPNRLYLNQGDGTFVEKAEDLGLDFDGASAMMAFHDFDLDGDLDGYLVTNNKRNYGMTLSGTGRLIDGRIEMEPEVAERAYAFPMKDGSFRIIAGGQFDHLYRNESGTGFTDISEEAGVHGPNHHGLSASWWDYDGDHWPDLYVANDFGGPDHLYNHNGDPDQPGFVDRVKTAVPHIPWYSMGTDAGDINNDGLPDLMGADMSASSHYRSKITMGDMSIFDWFLDNSDPPQYMRNVLFLNTGLGSFLEAAQMTGMANTDWTWSVRMADLDCDGWQDVFITTGMTRDFMNSDFAAEVSRIKRAHPQSEDGRDRRMAQSAFWTDKPPLFQPNIAFKNRGGLVFEDVAEAWGLNESSVGFGAATGDLDGDGDLDIVINNYLDRPSVLRNHAGAEDERGANRIKVQLRGRRSNSHGIGANIRIETESGRQMRYLALARGYMSSSEPCAFFGVGPDDRIASLAINWPSGHFQEFTNLEANRYYTVTEPAGSPGERLPAPDPVTLLAEVDHELNRAAHRETPFDDFKQQPLLPNRLSQLGPGLAVGDLDGNGQDDLYLGGAAGQAGFMLFRHGERYLGHRGTTAVLESDKDHEDMAPLFVDVDADGDLDLYVVSGGVECPGDSPLLRDRLYLNKGGGEFVKAPGDAIPDVRDSGSTAVAADYDRDGDLDIFVGGRVVPGEYPATPSSRLLRNDSESESAIRFTDVTSEDAEDLQDTGMVTGALWTDTDNDGWVDLVVTHEWGPVKVFRNQKGQLLDETREAGLGERLGWYNSVAGGDIDHDGDIDLVVANFGRNTKYHPSPESPVHIYYGDFEGTGRKHIVEAAIKKGSLLPIRGKSCSQNAMPFLQEKFPTYHSFASELLEGIYTEECLEEATRLTVNNLDSGVLINDGQGRFGFRSLPTLAQISPGFGLALLDVDADGHLDITMVQNFFGPQRETGRYDGGVGVVLKGNGKGGFEQLWPDESGLHVREDATSLVMTDVDDDRIPDFICGVNDGALRVFRIRSRTLEGRHASIELEGSTGNPTAIGSQVTVRLDDGTTQVSEIYAGHGYLSQSPARLYLGLTGAQKIREVSVRWPDGSTSTTKPETSEQLIIRQPAKASVGQLLDNGSDLHPDLQDGS